MKFKLYVIIIWTSILCTSRVYGNIACPDLQNWRGGYDNFPNGWKLLWAKNSQTKFNKLLFQGAWIFDVRAKKPAECHYAYPNNHNETVLLLQNLKIRSAPEGPSFKFLANAEISAIGAHCVGYNVTDCKYVLNEPIEEPPTTPPALPPSVKQRKRTTPSKPPVMAPLTPAPSKPPIIAPLTPAPSKPPVIAPVTPAPSKPPVMTPLQPAQ